MGHVVLMGETRNVYKILVGKLLEKRPVGRLTVDRRTMLKWYGELEVCKWFRIGSNAEFL